MNPRNKNLIGTVGNNGGNNGNNRSAIVEVNIIAFGKQGHFNAL